MEPIDKELHTVLDRAAVAEVLGRYVQGVDRKDWALVASCFTPGATADYGRETVGKVHVLVSCAGIGGFAPILQITDQQWDQMLGIHIRGSVSICSRGPSGHDRGTLGPNREYQFWCWPERRRAMHGALRRGESGHSRADKGDGA